jgi:nucleoside diphosphate kinase
MTVEPSQVLGPHGALLVLFSPDCLRSGLAGNLEHEISSKTGFKPSFRFLTRMDARTIEAFYAGSMAAMVPFSHLVTRLLSADPSLCAVYPVGDQYRRLAWIKGARHPANSSDNSLRGSFWCDNSICNLLHVSDDPNEAEREFRLLAHGLDAESVRPARSLIEPRAEPWRWVEHCGILTLYRVLRRSLLMDGHLLGQEPAIPRSGSSRETFVELRAKLEELASSSDGVRRVVEAYLAGQGGEVAATLERRCLPTSWEQLVIECGCTGVNEWSRRPLEEAVTELAKLMDSQDIHEWLVGGSAALKLCGLSATPADIDVRCSERALRALSAALGQPCNAASCDRYVANTIELRLLGWDVEFVGDLRFAGGVSAAVDGPMLSKERPSPVVQSVEDLIAEYLLLNRDTGAGKDDLHKVQQLFLTFRAVIDLEYLRERMLRWGISMDLVTFYLGG